MRSALTTVLTLTAGTLFVTWLAWQITARGVGNGIALILCLGIVLQLPQGIVGDPRARPARPVVGQSHRSASRCSRSR